MLKIYFLIFLIISSIVNLVVAINECNQSHPSFEVNLCNKLKTPEYRLNNYLLKNYNRQVRPVLVNNAVVHVRINLNLRKILNLDAVSQTFSVHGWLHLNWVDEFLRWNYDDFNRQSSIRLSSKNIWTPDITIHNGKESSFDRELYEPLVLYNGNVTWVVPKDIESNCIVDLRFFPFDDQVCKIQFGSWVFNQYQLDVHNINTVINTSSSISNEWIIESTEVRKQKPVYFDLVYPTIEFEFRLTRNYFNYTLIILFPILVLSILTILIFSFSIETNLRIGLAIVVLLGFFGVLFYIQTNIATNSQHLPFLSIFLIILIIILILAIISLAIVDNFSKTNGKLPESLKNACCRTRFDNVDEENEWKSVAQCLDKFFFILFLIFILLFLSAFIVLFTLL